MIPQEDIDKLLSRTGASGHQDKSPLERFALFLENNPGRNRRFLLPRAPRPYRNSSAKFNEGLRELSEGR